MQGFEIHTVATRPELAEVAARYGFVPNLFAILAEAPAALETYATLASILDKTSLSPTERQIVLLAVSHENGCGYCMAAHSAIAGMLGVSAEVIAALRDGQPLAEPRLEALRTLTTRIVRDRGFLPPAQVQAFFDAGYTRAQLLEVLVGVAIKTFSNYVNHLAETPLDEAFASQAWAPNAG